MALAFQAGLLNIGGFMACHRFVSHVTGFATFFGLEASLANKNQAAGMLAVPLFFLFGAMISGQLVDIRLKLHKKPKYYLTFGLIFFLVLIVLIGGWLGYFGQFGEAAEFTRDYVLLALLCLICGIQNGTVTSVSRSVVRTTHLTGITTDLGIGLMRLWNKNKLGDQVQDDSRANWMRIGILLSFGFGSVAGGFIFRWFEYGGFLVPALTSGLLFGMMYYFQVYKEKLERKI
ncbi:MAG: YoaK family protein [Bdellovibrionales bacterium]